MKKPTSQALIALCVLIITLLSNCGDSTNAIIEEEPEDLSYLEEDVDSLVDVSMINFEEQDSYEINGETEEYNTENGRVGYSFNQDGEVSFCGVDSDFIAIDSLPPQWEGGFTISVRVAFDDVRSFSRIIDFGNGKGQENGANIVLARLGETDDIVFSHWINNIKDDVQGIVAPDAITIGKFVFIGVTVSPSGLMSIFIDGEQVASKSGSPILNVGRGQNFVGRSHWCGRDPDFKGKIEDILIFNETLSSEQIKAIHRRDDTV